nr:MAG TPA: hypothetical protein [Caudoviricetes sp.]
MKAFFDLSSTNPFTYRLKTAFLFAFYVYFSQKKQK